MFLCRLNVLMLKYNNVSLSLYIRKIYFLFKNNLYSSIIYICSNIYFLEFDNKQKVKIYCVKTSLISSCFVVKIVDCKIYRVSYLIVIYACQDCLVVRDKDEYNNNFVKQLNLSILLLIFDIKLIEHFY